MSTQPNLQKLLVENFTSIKLRSPAFSLRAFAKKLNLSPAALSEMMNGKRPVSDKTAVKIFEHLKLSNGEQEKLIKVISGKRALKTPLPYQAIEMDQYSLISNWYYFGILSLAETENFSDDPAWIADRLNIKLTDAKTALKKLERLGMLKRNEQGTLEATGASFKTSTDVSSMALKRSHVENLELAQKSLMQDDVSIRDFSSMTMAIDPDLLPEAKKMITEFRRKLTQFLESSTKREVYKFNIQLFPISSKASKK